MATVLLLIAVLIARFDVVSDESLDLLTGVTAGTDGGDGDELAASPAELASAEAQRYGGLEVVKLDARSIPQNNSGAPIIVVDLAVRNITDTEARLPQGLLELVDVEGRSVALTRFEFTDFRDRLVIPAGQVERTLAVFKLSTAASTDLGLYQLHIGELGRWPVVIPLAGDPLPSLLPRPIAVLGGEAASTVAYDDYQLTVLDATTTLNHGSYRATTDEYVAVITLAVAPDPNGPNQAANSGAEPLGAAPDPALAALQSRERWTLGDSDSDSDGGTEAVRVSALPDLAPPGGQALELVFTHPTDALVLNLMLDEPDLAVARLRLSSAGRPG